MTEILLYVIILTTLFAAVAWKAGEDLRRERKAFHGEAEVKKSDNKIETLSSDEKRTRLLIGDEAYTRMVANVDEVLLRHTDDTCQSIAISTSPDDEEGWSKLHQLLPGDELELVRTDLHGVECVDVMSEGVRIGRLMLTAAQKAIEIMKHYTVKGVYVAEQNSYGDSDIMSMRVIIFYNLLEMQESVEESETVREVDDSRRLSDCSVSGLLRKIPLSAEISFRLSMPGSSDAFTLIQN